MKEAEAASMAQLSEQQPYAAAAHYSSRLLPLQPLPAATTAPACRHYSPRQPKLKPPRVYLPSSCQGKGVVGCYSHGHGDQRERKLASAWASGAGAGAGGNSKCVWRGGAVGEWRGDRSRESSACEAGRALFARRGNVKV